MVFLLASIWIVAIENYLNLLLFSGSCAGVILVLCGCFSLVAVYGLKVGVCPYQQFLTRASEKKGSENSIGRAHRFSIVSLNVRCRLRHGFEVS